MSRIFPGERFAPAVAFVALTLAPELFSSPAKCQATTLKRDSAKVAQLDTVVITPNRSANSIRNSSVAVSTLPGAWIRALPFRSAGDVLAIAPGIAVVDVGSLGGNPRIIARGFYGGGDTDYVPAEIDGAPIAALNTGTVETEEQDI